MQNVFMRKEKKYIITADQGECLQKLTAQRMKIDQHGEYILQNLYYDTDDWEIIRESMDKPLYSEKLRLRFYGEYQTDSMGFLELKKKYKGITYKRRIEFPMEHFRKCRLNETISRFDSQISREIRFFLERKTVSEKMYIAYKRLAYTGTDDIGLRVTFDRDIRFKLCSVNNADYFTQNNDNHNFILGQNQLLMEIKITGAIPLWLARALNENNIFPISFSKYGACYAKHTQALHSGQSFAQGEAGNAA